MRIASLYYVHKGFIPGNHVKSESDYYDAKYYNLSENYINNGRFHRTWKRLYLYLIDPKTVKIT